MKIFLIILFTIIGFNVSLTQEYKAAFGLKSGYPGFVGLNLKKPFGQKKKVALDVMAGTNFDSENRFVTGQILLEMNKPIGINTIYNWYYGLGPTVQYYTSGGQPTDTAGVFVGGLHLKADVFLGFELTQSTSPFNFAADIGPAIYFLPSVKVGFQFNVALRYAFKE